MKSRVLRAFIVTLIAKEGVANPWFIGPSSHRTSTEWKLLSGETYSDLSYYSLCIHKACQIRMAT